MPNNKVLKKKKNKKKKSQRETKYVIYSSVSSVLFTAVFCRITMYESFFYIYFDHFNVSESK